MSDNGMLEPSVAAAIERMPGVESRGIRVGNWLTKEQADDLLNAPDPTSLSGAVSVRVKQGVNAWLAAAKIEEGRLLRAVSKSGKLRGEGLSDWAIWSVVEKTAKEIGIERFGAHDLRRTCAKLCRKAGNDLEQIKFLLGHSSIQTTERYLGSEQEIAIAVKDNLGF